MLRAFNKYTTGQMTNSALAICTKYITLCLWYINTADCSWRSWERLMKVSGIWGPSCHFQGVVDLQGTLSDNISCWMITGGGSVTFGAPMVVYSLSPSKLYDQLQKLEAAAEKQAGDAHPPLQFHNFVNGNHCTSLAFWSCYCRHITRHLEYRL